MQESSKSRGATSWNDQVNKTFFDPVEPVDTVKDCPGGVCPVPWAKDEIVVHGKPGGPFAFGRPELQEDKINHPSHYKDQGPIECIEAIESQLTPEEYQGYLRGACVKYLWRWKNKGGVEDLKKCRWYLDRLIETEEN